MGVTKTRDYKFEAKLYLDTTDYDYIEVIEKLKCVFSCWAYILHDKDTRWYRISEHPSLNRHLNNPYVIFRLVRHSRVVKGRRNLLKKHIHFYGKNNSNRQFSLPALIRYLEIPYKFSQNGDFRFVSSWDSAMAYSIHFNAPDKYQYSVLEVKTNIRGFASKYLRYKRDLHDELNSVYSFIAKEYMRKKRPPSYWELVRWCNDEELSIHIQKPLLIKDVLYSFKNPDKI